MTTLTDIDKQIAELQAQKERLLAEEKDAALKKVMDAIKELNDLGFNYSLTEGKTSTAGGGKRRTGVKASVLSAIQKAADGLDRSGVIEALDAHGDTSLSNSISNALSQLKKSGAVSHDTDSGVYKSS